MVINEEPAKLEKVVVISVAAFHPAFMESVSVECKKHELSDEARDALITQLINHVLQYQAKPVVEHLERHTLMAINIIRDNGISEPDVIISSWVPILLATTAGFITQRLRESSPSWVLVAYIDGSIYMRAE